MFSKNSLNLNFIVFSGYKKALKTKQKTIAAFVWGKQSKCKLLAQALLQKIQEELLQETKHKNTPQYDFTNEEKLSERFDDCQVKRILQRLLQEIKKKHATVWLYQRNPVKVLMTVGFLYFFKTGCEFHRFVSWCNLRVIWRPIWFLFRLSYFEGNN